MPSLYDELLIAAHGIWNRRWLALAVAWVVCALGWLGVSMIPNSYQSRAKIYVTTQSVIQDKVGISAAEQEKSLNSLRQTLMSSDNLAKVVRGTDLAGTVASDADIAGRAGMLRRNITITSNDDNMFEVSTVMSDSSLSDRANARIAQQVTQKLIDLFQQANISGNRDETRQGLAFLDQQITETGKGLAAVEQKRVEFEQRVGLLPGSGPISERMTAARGELNQLEPQLAAAQSALMAINGQLAATPATIPGVGLGGGLTALSQAQADLAAARARGWTAEHPDVIALQRQIAALKAQGGGNSAASAGGVSNPAYLSLKSLQAERMATAQMLQSRKAQIQADINGMVARQINEPGLDTEQEKIKRDYNVLKNQYDKLLSDREEVRLRGDVQNETTGTTFRVIDPPGLPGTPSSPNRPLLLVGVLVAGLGVGVGAAFAMGQLRQTFPTVQKLAKVAGAPVIGSVTENLSPAQLGERNRWLKMFMGGCAALGCACMLLIVVEFVQRGMA